MEVVLHWPCGHSRRFEHGRDVTRRDRERDCLKLNRQQRGRCFTLPWRGRVASEASGVG